MTFVDDARTSEVPDEPNDPLAAALLQVANLEIALRTSRVIGAAIGILMERGKITMDEAFASLLQASQHRNRKLRDVADELVATGALPDGPPG